jgi:hypothetical protein
LYQERPEQEKKEKKGDDNAEEKPSNLLKKWGASWNRETSTLEWCKLIP